MRVQLSLGPSAVHTGEAAGTPAATPFPPPESKVRVEKKPEAKELRADPNGQGRAFDVAAVTMASAGNMETLPLEVRSPSIRSWH